MLFLIIMQKSKLIHANVLTFHNAILIKSVWNKNENHYCYNIEKFSLSIT